MHRRVLFMYNYLKDQETAINFQSAIYTPSMGVLRLWQKHLCLELIDLPMRLVSMPFFSFFIC